jgi:hypothetical protein
MGKRVRNEKHEARDKKPSFCPGKVLGAVCPGKVLGAFCPGSGELPFTIT